MKRTLLLILVLFATGCSATAPQKTSVPAAPATSELPAPSPVSTAASAPITPSAPATPASPAPSPPPVTLEPPTLSSFGGLTLAVYALGSQLGEEQFGAVMSKRPGWMQTAGPQTEAYNKRLAPLGYRLTVETNANAGHPVYTLWQGNRELAILDSISPLTLNAKGDNFALVGQGRTGGPWLFQKGEDQVWDTFAHEFLYPVYLGNDLVMVTKNTNGPDVAGRVDFNVQVGKKAVFSMKATSGPIENPLKNLQVWQNHWVLEVAGDVIIDGQSLKAQTQDDELFDWRSLSGKPFYLYRKDGRYGAIYDGKPLPQNFEDVIHYKCCSPAMFNAGGDESGAWFFGKRDGQWYFVELSQEH